LGDILHDPKISNLTGDEFRLFFNIMAALCQSGSQDGVIRLTPTTLRALACRQQTRHSEPMLSRLVAVGLTTMSRVGADYLTTVPNWAKLQGYAPLKKENKEKKERGGKQAASPPPAPSPIWGNTFDSTPEGEVTELGKTRVTPVETPTPQQHPKGTCRPKAKRGTRCPEDLTPEQWAQVRAWRDTKHPEFDDLILKREWEKHAAHYGSLETLRSDWVRSFYSWLLKCRDFQTAASGSGGIASARPTPPVVHAEVPPPPLTDDDRAEIAEISAERRKNRRARHVEAPEAN
jgi:hypothetical protein